MKQLTKALMALGIALILMFAVRAYFFTIYKVPTDIDLMLRRGDRVMVNRYDRPLLHVGDLVVFRKGADYVGRVQALPGDTVQLGAKRYVIPTQCCRRCTCPYCQLFLIDIGGSRTLVYRHQMVGRARYLFHLPI